MGVFFVCKMDYVYMYVGRYESVSILLYLQGNTGRYVPSLLALSEHTHIRYGMAHYSAGIP